jgi:hypothetical protein
MTDDSRIPDDERDRLLAETAPIPDGKFNELLYRLNSAIIGGGDPKASIEENGRTHGIVNYDTMMVLEALATVAASVAAQSREFSTPKSRRDVADHLRQVFLKSYGYFESAAKEMMDRYLAGQLRQ